MLHKYRTIYEYAAEKITIIYLSFVFFFSCNKYKKKTAHFLLSCNIIIIILYIYYIIIALLFFFCGQRTHIPY